jgi:tRNA dimethylallyltransferase
MISVHIVAGPTASGKTGYAISLAQKQGGVIINADSVQLYDALPVLSARPSPEEQAMARHELFGVLHPAESCSAARWRDMALEQIYKANEQGYLPVLAGGTGFYIKALTEGLSPVPQGDQDLRRKLVSRHEQIGAQEFFGELVDSDPLIASTLAATDTQRVIRAAEVFELTGKSITYWQSQPPENAPDDLSFTVHILLPPREEIHRKINARFDEMIKLGALEEVRALDALINSGEVPEDAEIVKAHGFRPLRSYLDNKISFEEAAEKTKAETRQYAKRQSTWLRHQIKLGPAVKKINVIENPISAIKLEK